jgi:hypothetical protein
MFCASLPHNQGALKCFVQLCGPWGSSVNIMTDYYCKNSRGSTVRGNQNSSVSTVHSYNVTSSFRLQEMSRDF